jgi:hypothetical protein
MRSGPLAIFILLIFFGCSNATKEDQKNELGYFDLKSFFHREADRLKKSNPFVEKTVMVNADAETKKIQITDWATELAMFANADINRASWKGLFSVQKKHNQEIYTSSNDKVPVKKVTISKYLDRVSNIQIIVANENSLYSSTDTLNYYPDSLYLINKTQHIKLLPARHYQVIGKTLK